MATYYTCFWGRSHNNHFDRKDLCRCCML